jgi:nucleoside 2-deoxyribosyltransferase
MPVEAKVYRILIASPRDVEEEEKIIREQSYKWNAANTMGMKKILMPIRWNTDATPSLEGRGQSVINSQLVDSCDLLIGIFRTRLGTPTPEADSGTVEEIERANNQGKPCLVYFHDPVTEVGIDKEQYQKLQIYKKELQTKGLTDNYNSLDEFRDKVYGHISSVVHKLSQEDKERRAAEQEAKLTEQAIGLPVQTIPTTFNTEISFKTLFEAQTSVKTLLDSRFGVQDMEDAKEQEIARIQSVLTSPELAELFSRQSSVETIPVIAQILEAATTPSMYALAAIGRYADETSPEWLDIVGDWIERLSTRKIEGYYKWPIYIKTYPGLLLLYTLGISALRAGKINFLKEVTSRQVYSDEYNSDTFLLNAIDPRYVFYRNISQMIEPGFERRFSPVSDHLDPLLKSKLYAQEEEARYMDWFDFFEFLLSFKAVQQSKENPYFGSFTWRWETKRFIFKMIQDAAIPQGRYGTGISDLFGGDEQLQETAVRYDEIATRSQTDFERVAPPNYIVPLIQLAKKGIRISSYNELAKYPQPN